MEGAAVNALIVLLSMIATAPAATATTSSLGQHADHPTVIIVVGAPGAPEYGRDFAQWAEQWAQAAKRGSACVTTIGSVYDPSTAPSTAPTTGPSTDREQLRTLLVSAVAEPAQPLWLVLIGHGTYDGKETKFNLRGPDVTDQELAEWLRPLRRPIAVIDCTASSAPFLNRLSAPGRVVITATRSGSELQFAHFGEFMAGAIADPSADLDKDGQTSLLEAFLAASHRVEEFYKQAGRLTTEHALLDDNGDGQGVSADWFEGLRATHAARNGSPIDGPRAHQWHLVMSASEQAIPQELRARRDEIELAIESLRQKKVAMPQDVYYKQLEELLLKLARLYEQIDVENKGS